jgi:3-deoxy-D-manno-octulosonic-acid transferase
VHPSPSLLSGKHYSGNGVRCLFETLSRETSVTFLYTLLYSMVLGTIAPLSPFIPKLSRGLRGRRGLLGRLPAGDSHNRPYWIHVASSGEFEQALPLMEEIQKRSSAPVILTYFSPSAQKAVTLETERRKNNGVSVPWDYADFSPLDFPWSVSHFLDRVKPKAFIAIHREIWPNIVEGCYEQGIPCFLFAAFFPEPRRRNLWLYRPWLRRFHKIGTVDNSSATFLQESFPRTSIQRLGDPREQRVMARRQMQKSPPWASFFANQRILIAASVWKKDFEGLKPTLQAALKAKTRLVLVPHELNEGFIQEMLSWVKAQGQPCRLWSSWLLSPDETSHLIVDKVGLLAELYSIAHIVFVGGSFVGRIHNVLEPAAYGKPIVTGPYIWNSAQAEEWNARGLGLKSAKDSGELRAIVTTLLQDESLYSQWSTFLKESLEDASSVAIRYVQQLP